MAALSDFQFELDGFQWGLGLPVFVDAEGFDPGDTDKITVDGTNPLNGARMFGRDLLGAETWTWSCFLSTENPEDALAAAAAMGRVWRDEKYAEVGVVSALRYALAGRTRVVYGRPRKFSFKPGNALLQGNLPPLATFDKVDTKHYDDVELFVDLQLVPQVEGGFAVPFTAPLTIDRDATAGTPGLVAIGGDAKTAPTVTFYGPSTNPKVVIGSFVVGLVGSIPAGASVVVDCRPWAQTVTKVGAVGRVSLSRDTRLATARLSPGNYQAVYSASDLTGSSRCRVAWRNANHTL